MSKIIYAVFIALFFIGCHSADEPKPTQKMFAAEDRYVVFALEAQKQHDYNSSAILFNEVYEKTDKIEYLYQSLQSLLISKQYQMLLTRTVKYESKYSDNAMLKRFEILALVNLNRVDEAKQKALALVSVTKEADDYIVLSDIYIKQNQFGSALRYLESAYNINYNEKIMDKISMILYVNLHKKNEAIAYLESHIKAHGCSELICARLASYYADNNNIDGMLQTYVRLYDLAPSDELAQSIIKLYVYKKDYYKLMLFLENSGANDPLLLQIYGEAKVYDKAAVLAKKLYDKSFDTQYLAQSAMFRYEEMPKNVSKKELTPILEDLKTAVVDKPNPIYYNYIGYLMIEHNIDVKQGIEYVKNALKTEPDSAYYLDSLAWGYYKLHECKSAKKIMDQVVDKIGAAEEEVKGHQDAINKCVQEEKE